MAYAQRHKGYCDSVESTADMQSCVNTHNEAAKEKLNSVYKDLVDHIGKEEVSAVSSAQKEWREFRDTQCAYEASLTPNEALRRVYELSCLTELTEDRSHHLAALKAREESGMPWELGDQPRWVNILTNKYPHVYWRYGEWMSVDLNCDDRKEDVMIGLDVKSGQEQSTLIIAVADNPVTGKPKASLFKVPLYSEIPDTAPVTEGAEEKIHLCGADVKLALISNPQIEYTDQTETLSAQDEIASGQAETTTAPAQKKPALCSAAIQIIDSQCKPLQLYRGAEKYRVDYFKPASGGDGVQ